MPGTTSLMAAGYHRDRRYLPSLDPACHIIREVSDSWVTDCIVKQGGSGGPVFIQENNELKIAAVVSATNGTDKSIAVPRKQWQSLLDNPSCGN
ncbi:trypsin-like serine peptidase [Roseibium algae]|uniref:Uncharacterized protein n=1 Tax=Roseibium algae TaxID=3123038 RepID=A0ABU8TNQ5_9HYPH